MHGLLMVDVMNTVFRITGEQSSTWAGGGYGDRHLLKSE